VQAFFSIDFSELSLIIVIIVILYETVFRMVFV